MKHTSERRVYLDFQATTPVDPRVLKEMLPHFSESYANPHSTEHAFGLDAAEAVEAGRAQVAALVGCDAQELVFTSGATESNNLALLGLAPGITHVVSSAIEHKSVLAVLDELKRRGMKVTLLPVDKDGRVDPERVAKVIRDRTLVSVMAANNEIGVIQPIREIAQVCADNGALFHTDAAQAVGKIPFTVAEEGISVASISSHKLYGPKGIGAIYVNGSLLKGMRPLFFGGGQEQGLRPGTVPTPLAVGFGAASQLAGQERDQDGKRLAGLRDWLIMTLQARIPDLTINGSMEHRLPGNLNVCIPDIEAEDLLHMLPDVALSTGSACTSRAQAPSHVLTALGLSYEQANSSVRLSVGRSTTQDDVAYAAARITEAVAALRG